MTEYPEVVNMLDRSYLGGGGSTLLSSTTFYLIGSAPWWGMRSMLRWQEGRLNCFMNKVFQECVVDIYGEVELRETDAS